MMYVFCVCFVQCTNGTKSLTNSMIWYVFRSCFLASRFAHSHSAVPLPLFPQWQLHKLPLPPKFKLPELPPKKRFGVFEETFLLTRRKALDNYLQALMAIEAVAVSPPMLMFLGACSVRDRVRIQFEAELY
jgi:hypothetical protein